VYDFIINIIVDGEIGVTNLISIAHNGKPLLHHVGYVNVMLIMC